MSKVSPPHSQTHTEVGELGRSAAGNYVLSKSNMGFSEGGCYGLSEHMLYPAGAPQITTVIDVT